MAKLFNKQADIYAHTRPTYPSQLFRFLAAHTPRHGLAWDVGAGSGQATAALAAIFDRVVATDTSAEQLAMAPAIENVRYRQTPSVINSDELTHIAEEGTVDLVTVAQAAHWFDLASFYRQVNRVLHKPDGVIGVWCYTEPRVNAAVDAAFWRLYTASAPFWAAARKKVDDEYRSIDFPFDPLHGLDHTGPFKFEAVKEMDLDMFSSYIRSWSAYQTAKERGVELLTEEVVGELERAWGVDNKNCVKTVVFPVHLRIGKVKA